MRDIQTYDVGFLKHVFDFACMCAHVYSSDHRGQKDTFDPWELELKSYDLVLASDMDGGI